MVKRSPRRSIEHAIKERILCNLAYYDAEACAGCDRCERLVYKVLNEREHEACPKGVSAKLVARTVELGELGGHVVYSNFLRGTVP